MTADGKIATENRAVSSFGSPHDLKLLLGLRATADAIMSGARTADLTPITLGPGPAKYRRLRLKHGLEEYNLRVIVSGSGTLNPKAEVFKHKFSPIIILTTAQAGAPRLKALRAVASEVRVFGRKDIDFVKALRWLRQTWKVKRLLCEGGGEINDALFRAGVVNELNLTVAPYVFGGSRAPTISDGIGVPWLKLGTNLQLKSARRRDKELFLVYKVKRPSKR